MSDEQINEIGRKLREIDKDLYLSFVRAENKDSWISQNSGKLEEDSWFTDKYKNIADFTGDRNKAISDLYRDLDGATPTKARLHSFTKKHPDISEQEVLDWFKKTNDYKLDEIRDRQYEADRMKRAKEVKELPFWKNLIASDYSKARYIDDPSTSILGGREFNPYDSESQKELRDVALGATAAALDFMPSIGANAYGGIWAGPAIRGVRDVLHTDEKYKPQGNIASSIFTDAAGNAATDILPTAILRKLEKGGKNAGRVGNWVGDAYYTKNLNNEIAINNEARQLGREAVERLEKTESTGSAFGGKQLENDIRRLPESEYKTLVEQEIKDGSTPLAALRKVEYKYQRNESAPVRELNEKLADRGLLRKSETATELQKKDILRPELTPGQEWAELAFRKLGPVGPGVVKAVEPGKKRDVDNLESMKEWYKANYARDWDNGFIPNYKPGSPLWEAFKEYNPEKAKEVEDQFDVNEVYKKWEKKIQEETSK